MTTQTLKQVELAAHWDTSQAYISKLRRPFSKGGKAMPDFETFAEADKWREMNAPPSRKRGGIQAKTAAQAPKNDIAATAQTPTSSKIAHEGESIDVRSFISPDEEFDVLMIRHAEEVPQIAFGLYKLAAESGDVVAIQHQVKNWGDASKHASSVRSRFLDIKQRTGELLPLDVCMNVVGITLGGIRSGLTRLGARAAREANPEDPARAQRAIDKEVDRIFAMALPGEDRIRRELLATVSPDESEQSD